jgi:hypothetical protein
MTSTSTKKVLAYQLAWNLETNLGSVRLWVEGIDSVIERDLNAASFQALGILLSAAPEAEVAIGKTVTGDSYIVGGKKDILKK